MRLDYDCIRDILFTVEETTTLAMPCFINQNYREYKRLEKYDFEKLAYHVHQCALHDYFTDVEFDEQWNCIIKDLSAQGHDFICSIRDNTLWNKVKRSVAELGSASLQLIPQIAQSLILTGINP